MKRLIISIIFIIIMNFCSGAEISGSIYDLELNLVQGVVVKVDSVPQQTFVSKDGHYSFTLSAGTYILEAEKDMGFDKLSSIQEISIEDEGEFILDMILIPDISEEDNLFDDPMIVDINYGKKPDYVLFALVVLLVVFVIIIIWKLFSHKAPTNVESEDDLPKQILEFIRSKGGRILQKEIRKEFFFSEAKISLIISELESEGLITKIKKGRGNIIILR